MKILNKLLRLSLQFFAEGSEGGGAEGNGAAQAGADIGDDDLFMAEMEQKYGVTDGVASAQAAEAIRSRGSVVHSEKAEEEPAEASEEEPKAEPKEEKSAEAEFDELIKSDRFKGIYGQRVAAALSERFKNHTDLSADNEKYKNALSMLSGKYGKNADDIDGTVAAILGDDELLEEEAYSAGKTVEALRSEKQQEAEKKARDKEIQDLKSKLREYENDRNARADAEKWAREAKETAKIYGDKFDLRAELKNPDFVKYLKRDKMSVTDAFEHAHLREIMASQLKAVEKKADENAAAAVRSNANRPRESAGAAYKQSQSPRIDVRNMTDEDFDLIDEMLARGEAVTVDHFR